MGFFQWKMSLFLSHISKLKNPRKMWTPPLIFNNTKIVRGNPRKMRHPSLIFNNRKVSQSTTQKLLGIILDNRLSFKEHLTVMGTKVSKTTSLLRKLQNISPRQALINFYKTFICPYLDHRDILCDKMFNTSSHQIAESIQYNVCLAITGAIRGSSRNKTYQELGLESLQHQRWYRNIFSSSYFL